MYSDLIISDWVICLMDKKVFIRFLILLFGVDMFFVMKWTHIIYPYRYTNNSRISMSLLNELTYTFNESEKISFKVIYLTFTIFKNHL